MSKHVPPISQYMTPMPYTVEAADPLTKALDLMRAYKIRHLPVRNGAKTTGLLSLQNADLLASFPTIDLQRTKVEAAMRRDLYCVAPETPLDLVAGHMADHKIDSALVIQEDGSLVGIFTDNDALRALAEVFQSRSRKKPDAPWAEKP